MAVDCVGVTARAFFLSYLGRFLKEKQLPPGRVVEIYPLCVYYNILHFFSCPLNNKPLAILVNFQLNSADPDV